MLLSTQIYKFYLLLKNKDPLSKNREQHFSLDLLLDRGSLFDISFYLFILSTEAPCALPYCPEASVR